MQQPLLRFRPDALLGALPVGRTGFFTHDDELAEALRRGDTPLDGARDVEIAASAAQLEGTAPVAVVVGGRARRRREAKLLRARGYDSVTVCRWAPGAAIGAGARSPRMLTARGSTALVGRRAPGASALEAMLGAAEASAAERLGIDRVWVRSSGLVGVGRRLVLRIGLGRTSDLLARHVEILGTVHREAGDRMRELTPRIVSTGMEGAARWSLEQRLPGGPPVGPQAATATLEECADVLASLYTDTNGRTPRPSASVAEEAVAAAKTPSIGSDVVAVARAADDRLAGLVGAIGHGDFWSGNLLLDGERITGIVDWAAGEANALPFLDLLHLLITLRRVPARTSLGEAVARWLRNGTVDSEVRRTLDRYGRATGVETDADALSSLVVAYWVRQVRRQVAQYAGLVDIDDWAARNVAPVLAAARAS